MENTYFAWLPNEIILQILKKLKHFDVLQFLEAFPGFNYVFRNLDLSVEYRIINLTQIASKKLIALEHITTLNVNYLHWISAVDLRRFINKLINLKSLYAIETKLDLTPNDVKTYKQTKIEKLAISSKYFIEAVKEPIPSVKALYINLGVEPNSVPYWIVDKNKTPTKLKKLFPNLTKIWVLDQLFSSSVDLLKYFDNYEKVFIQRVDFNKYDNISRGKYYDTSRELMLHILCIDKLEFKEFLCQQPFLTYLIENHATDALWSSVLKMLNRLPFGPSDTRVNKHFNNVWSRISCGAQAYSRPHDLIFNKVDLNNICLKDLNLFHYVKDKDNHLTFSQMQRDILSSKNAQTLRSLCFLSCVLMVEGKSEQKSEDNFIVFKKPRVALNSQTSPEELEPMKELFENLSNLEELVLFSCSQFSLEKIPAYSFISKCTNLRSLSIDIPQGCNGELFLSIFKECTFLETVKICSDVAQNEQFNYNFLKALPMANNLKNLFFQNDRVPLEKFITALTNLQSRKLQRVALVCTEGSTTIPFDSLKAFTISSPQLMFLLIAIKNATKISLKTYKRLFKGLATHPAQTFVVQKDFSLHEDGIPRFHHNLLGMGSWQLASIDPARDFDEF